MINTDLFPDGYPPVILHVRVLGYQVSHPSLILLNALRNPVAPLVERGVGGSPVGAATLSPSLLRAAFAPPIPIGLDVAVPDSCEMNWEGG